MPGYRYGVALPMGTLVHQYVRVPVYPGHLATLATWLPGTRAAHGQRLLVVSVRLAVGLSSGQTLARCGPRGLCVQDMAVRPDPWLTLRYVCPQNTRVRLREPRLSPGCSTRFGVCSLCRIRFVLSLGMEAPERYFRVISSSTNYL